MDRRDVLCWLSAGAAAGCSQSPRRVRSLAQAAQPKPESPRGLPPLKITDITTILTAPNRIRLVIVKVSTSEPGLYGLGCATFTQRAYAVQTAVDKYLKPFLIGRDVDQIEDIWQSSYVSSYWRNGPVLFNAMSGVDMALWDIKGKRANMPVYQLLGGKCRFAAALYAHVQGPDVKEVEENARKAMAKGYRHIRVQVAHPGPGHLRHRCRHRAQRACRSRGDRADQPQVRLGARPLPAHPSQAVRAPTRRRWATTSSCSTMCTSGSHPARRSTCARSWRNTTCSSWKTRCRPRRRTTSG